MAKSELLEEEKEIKPPEYSEQEKEYLDELKERMECARDTRDQARDEWDGMDYVTQYESNERIANTFIPPKVNKEDTNFQSGIVRQKLFAQLSAVTNLNLSGDISAYDKDGLKIQSIGDAMEDIMLRISELDGDEEKKFLRHYELLKHGTVFVEESWYEREKVVKKAKKFDGKIKGASWTQKIEKALSHPTRGIIPGPNVYLGDITKYCIEEQPFIFTIDKQPRSIAKLTFGKWERWKNVPEDYESDDFWSLSNELQEDQVEIIRYQDKWANEFAIIINGVLMTPIGLPLPYGMDEYTIAQQNLEPIHSKFAYGKSLVARIKNKAAILDEMSKLGVLKTQKSFVPTYLNMSGRMLSARSFMPGKILNGIPAGSVVPLNDKESQGVTNSELAMIKEIQASIDSETTSPVFSGQQAQGSPTATEIIEIQRQAKMILGLTIFSISLLEWKLEWLRLKLIINNWFTENEKKNLVTAVERYIEGEGNGKRIVIPTDEVPSPEAVMQVEDALSKEQGIPIRLIFLNPDKAGLAKLFWQISVRAKEKKSSEVEKLLFRAEVADAQIFGPLLNMDYLADRFASVWNENPQKMFKKEQQVMQQAQQSEQAPALPTPEKAIGRQLKTQIGVNV